MLWNLEEEQWIGQVYIAIETWGFPPVSGHPSSDSQDLEPAMIHHTEFVKTCNGHTELKKYLCSEDVGLSVMQFRQSDLVLNPNRISPWWVIPMTIMRHWFQTQIRSLSMMRRYLRPCCRRQVLLKNFSCQMIPGNYQSVSISPISQECSLQANIFYLWATK